jgi:TonB family protein
LFEFTLPTESARQSPRSLAASIAVHGLAIALLFAIRFAGVSKFPTAPEHVTLIVPARETPIAPPKVQAPRHREFHPLPSAPAHLELPAPAIPAPAIEIPKPVLADLPRVATPVAPSLPAIKQSGFTEPKPASPVPAAKPVIRTSGFESTETSTTRPAARGALSTVGSFESAHSAEGAPARSTTARPGGFSDASAAAPAVGRRTTTASAAFGDSTVEKSSSAPKPAAAAARITPIEILSKPKPAYTAEARAKNIEGEVVVEVQFNASGAVRVLRVVRGLGAGLDETAIAAAQGIRFRPATQDGTAVDSTALVHILFQLAN